MTRDVAPVIAAQALLAHGVDGEVIRLYIALNPRAQRVDAIDGRGRP